MKINNKIYKFNFKKLLRNIGILAIIILYLIMLLEINNAILQKYYMWLV